MRDHLGRDRPLFTRGQWWEPDFDLYTCYSPSIWKSELAMASQTQSISWYPNQRENLSKHLSGTGTEYWDTTQLPFGWAGKRCFGIQTIASWKSTFWKTITTNIDDSISIKWFTAEISWASPCRPSCVIPISWDPLAQKSPSTWVKTGFNSKNIQQETSIVRLPFHAMIADWSIACESLRNDRRERRILPSP